MLGAILLSTLAAHGAPEPAAGIAWQVKGLWQIEGSHAPIRSGDAIPPGSLLRPDAVASQHTVIVLMPDGQRILYECFTVGDCARGFRVPSLHQTPEPFAVDMLARIRSILLRGHQGFSAAADMDPPVGSPRDEIVSVLGPDNHLQLAGLASKLPDGKFTYDLLPLDPVQPSLQRLHFEKTGPSVTILAPATGLYVLTIDDDANLPRMHLFVAVVSAEQEANVTKSFHDAKILMQKWNDDFYGWPTHQFQWAYLESLIAGVQPVTQRFAVAAGQNVSRNHSSGEQQVTAEPTFSPMPGTLPGDANIALQCSTPGATIHFTVDTSQPMSASPVYGAPIVIMTSGLTIKAFATSPGRKDSAVVTGVFRIRKQPSAAH